MAKELIESIRKISCMYVHTLKLWTEAFLPFQGCAISSGAPHIPAELQIHNHKPKGQRDNLNQHHFPNKKQPCSVCGLFLVCTNIASVGTFFSSLEIQPLVCSIPMLDSSVSIVVKSQESQSHGSRSQSRCHVGYRHAAEATNAQAIIRSYAHW